MAHDCVALSAQDFMRQGTGVICCYSLKNTRFPEYVFNTDAGVCCLEPRPDYERVCLGTSNAISHMHGRQDWHPAHPAVLAVGLYDGTVLVYDVRAKTKKPIYQSTVSRLPISLFPHLLSHGLWCGQKCLSGWSIVLPGSNQQAHRPCL